MEARMINERLAKLFVPREKIDPFELGRLHQEYGRTIHQSWHVPSDEVICLQGEIIVHPSVWMRIKHNGVPFWTRHMAGVREAERDQRKFKR